MAGASPLFAVSSLTGEGMNNLAAWLEEIRLKDGKNER
jgi:hypothetical protein